MKAAEKLKPQERPDIFRYHHYRAFLLDWFRYRKAEDRRFSLRWLARQARLSPGYLPLALSGKRRLTADGLEKLVPWLGLSERESHYLRLMRTVAEADTPEQRTRALERIQRSRIYRESNPKEALVFRYLTRWFYVVIREMAASEDFELDAKWIQRRLRGRVTVQEVEQAIEFLMTNGFIEALPDGKARLRDRDVTCKGEVFGLALREFHQEITSVVFESIDDTPGEQHFISGHTFWLGLDEMPKARAIIEEALRKLADLGSGSKASGEVVHASLMIAPVTRRSEEDEDD